MMNSLLRGALGASACLLAAAPAEAQDAAAPAAPEPAAVPAALDAAPAAAPAAAAAPDPAACELYLFPSENVRVQKTGWLAGFGVAGAIADAAINADAKVTLHELIDRHLDPKGQAAALESTDLAALLKKPGLRIVVADAPLTPEQNKAWKKARAGRGTGSKAPCYSELLIGRIFYHKAPVWGAHLITSFHYRDFSGPTPRTFSGKGKKSLDGFPPKTPEDVARAEAALRDTFARTFVEYVEDKVHPAPAKKR